MGEEHDEIWFVQLRSGETRAWSLDELDNAFQSNVIDESTLVRRDGEVTWAPLAQVLAESDGTEQTAAIAENAYIEAPNSLSPQIVAQPWGAPYPSAPPPPVVSEVFDLDPDALPFKRSRKGIIAGGFIAAAVIAVVAVTGGRIVAQHQAIVKIEQATKAAAAANAIAAATPTPVAAPTADPPPVDNAPRLSDDQKSKVLAADKKREAEKAKRDAEAAKKAARNAPRKASKGADPIRKGGSKYDPLNGSL